MGVFHGDLSTVKLNTFSRGSEHSPVSVSAVDVRLLPDPHPFGQDPIDA